ncbi:MAG: hypothetical protein A2138_17205 [Deltaproteobacteria bacterium RBG_16_71_12]|nr:MAG: hypothetical protein A2138_17205 [Deltaproteobacteria bacterium RBG_16_71_12]
MPGVPFSTMKARMPSLPLPLSTVAHATTTSAQAPMVGPEIVSAQQEHLTARGQGERGKKIARSALDRLAPWGMSRAEIEAPLDVTVTARWLDSGSPGARSQGRDAHYSSNIRSRSTCSSVGFAPGSWWNDV